MLDEIRGMTTSTFIMEEKKPSHPASKATTTTLKLVGKAVEHGASAMLVDWTLG